MGPYLGYGNESGNYPHFMLINEIIRQRNKTKWTKWNKENLTQLQREGMDRRNKNRMEDIK